MMQLILSSNNAGKPADTVRWAEALIALDPRGTHSDGARRMAAIGYTGLGRFGDAERHLRTAIEQASFPEKRAEALAQLGQLALSQGRLDEAESHARAAESLRPGKVQLPWLVIGQVAKARGRLEQAVQALEHACTIDLSHIPAQNRRGRAAIHRELATLHAELGRGDVALALIAEAEIELAGDRIEEIILDAAAALVHAFRRERGLATARIDAACDGRMPEIEDQTSRQVMLILVIRARLLIGDIAQAESLLHELLAVGLAPPSYPFAYYHLAECRRRAGDEEGAREFDSKAASTQFGTRWEQLARQRLAAESITRS
jgi:tetratricopeptide (TPR) repeat protein